MDKVKNTLRYILYFINITAIICTLISGFGGYVSPEYFKAIPAIALMTFPVWFIVMPVLVILTYFFSKKFMIANIVTMIVCIDAALTFCPMNIIKNTSAENIIEIKVMSYNTYHYKPYKEDKFTTDSSLTMAAIIESGADIVCIQEGILPEKISKRTSHATDSQKETICKIYPYRISDSEGISTLSKYPVKMIESPYIPGESGNLQIFQYDIDGTTLEIYNIHLQSFGFSEDDKDLYKKLTKGQVDNNIKRSKNQLLGKLSVAFKHHAEQAAIIRNALDQDTTKNVILCGDFNDIAGCYAQRVICGDDMYDCFRDCAIGPSITYRDNRFYFHIDQMMCRKAITTTDIYPIHAGASDHYPIMATVCIQKK